MGKEGVSVGHVLSLESIRRQVAWEFGCPSHTIMLLHTTGGGGGNDTSEGEDGELGGAETIQTCVPPERADTVTVAEAVGKTVGTAEVAEEPEDSNESSSDSGSEADEG